MEKTIPFAEVLEAADQLSLDEQETLLDILHRRTIEHRRAVLAKDIESAQEEFRLGNARPVTPEELTKEILS